jgi:hypothetical protein
VCGTMLDSCCTVVLGVCVLWLLCLSWGKLSVRMQGSSLIVISCSVTGGAVLYVRMCVKEGLLFLSFVRPKDDTSFQAQNPSAKCSILQIFASKLAAAFV